ncbi:MAG TPA: response regulator [Bryobacteraceae bacterium]|nr:response regulator [Bryobacteraceae bacterium]
MKPSQSVALIVDDDSNIRNFISLLIQQRGYSLLTASDGQEALTLSRSHAGAIDLLVSDVNMPRLNGIDLAGRLTDERPGIRVLMMSGIEQATLGLPFLKKPFLPDQLWRKLEQVFTEPPEEPRELAQLVGAAMPAGQWED